MGLVNTHPPLILKVVLVKTFFDVLTIHRWDTPVVIPVGTGLSLEDPICSLDTCLAVLVDVSDVAYPPTELQELNLPHT